MKENGKVTQKDTATFVAPVGSYYDPREHGSHMSIDQATGDRVQTLTSFNGNIVERRFPAISTKVMTFLPEYESQEPVSTRVNGHENGHHPLEGEFIVTPLPNGNGAHHEVIAQDYPPKFDARRYDAYMQGPGGEASRRRAAVYEQMLRTGNGK